MSDAEILKRITRILEKWTSDIEELAKELKCIPVKSEESYKISISDKAKDHGRKIT